MVNVRDIDCSGVTTLSGAALARAKRMKPTIVVAELDRLARNTGFVSAVMDSGVDFFAVDNPFARRLTLHILAAVAEHEAAMIAARTKAALQAASARGRKLGGLDVREAAKLGTAQKVADDRAYARNVAPIIAKIERSGVATLQGVAAAVEARGVETPRGAACLFRSRRPNLPSCPAVLHGVDRHYLPVVALETCGAVAVGADFVPEPPGGRVDAFFS